MNEWKKSLQWSPSHWSDSELCFFYFKENSTAACWASYKFIINTNHKHCEKTERKKEEKKIKITLSYNDLTTVHNKLNEKKRVLDSMNFSRPHATYTPRVFKTASTKKNTQHFHASHITPHYECVFHIASVYIYIKIGTLKSGSHSNITQKNREEYGSLNWNLSAGLWVLWWSNFACKTFRMTCLLTAISSL